MKIREELRENFRRRLQEKMENGDKKRLKHEDIDNDKDP
jgi:hypothetical protein